MSEAAGRVILGLDPGTASTGYGVISVQGNRFRHGTKLIRFRPDKDPLACTWAELRPPRDAEGLTVSTLLGEIRETG